MAMTEQALRDSISLVGRNILTKIRSGRLKGLILTRTERRQFYGISEAATRFYSIIE